MSDTTPAAEARPTPESSIVPIIREMITNKADPAQLSALLAVRKDWEADEARKSFAFAVSEFQRRAPIVEKGDDANGKQYAALDRIWRTVSPLLTELGLAITWHLVELRAENQVCHLEGVLRHRDGHEQALRYDMPIPDAIVRSDGKPVQNKAQVMGSAYTYGKRYALCAALGIVTGEDSDDDGNALTTIERKEQDEIFQCVEAWRGLASWTKEREDVFWRFVNVPKLTGGRFGYDLAKLPLTRLMDVKDMIKRLLKGTSK